MTQASSHKRLNLLTGDWVLVSPHRLSRPWQGEISDPKAAPSRSHDPSCYLCPGAPRVGGAINPDYRSVHVFANDFPALLETSPGLPSDDIFVSEPETGLCRVICYSPRHDAAMSALDLDSIQAVVRAWMDQTSELMALRDIAAVTIFENRGEMMGASNPHPHGQIWASRTVPNELRRETDRQTAWLRERGRPLLSEYLDREIEAAERVVLRNEHFVVLTPFWSAWPFETLLAPRRPIRDLTELADGEIISLADILSRLTQTYDAVFNTPFPYTMGWHQRPSSSDAEGFVVHAHFYPPLLRSASIRKFMVGFEMLGGPQRDLTPEVACARLREAAARAGVGD